jgi:hypothetical protein
VEVATEGNEQRPAAERADGLAELRAVVAKAKAGDAAVLPRLREILDREPGLVKHYGDLARHAETAWVALASGNNLYMRETLARAAEARRSELTRPGAGAVERLLVERVVACSAQLNYFSATEANRLAAGDSYRQLQFHAKRVGQAQRMHLAAVGALVAYQRLVPASGVEIAARDPARSDVDREPIDQPVSVAPPPVYTPAFADEPAPQECDGREPVRLRIPY